MISSKRVTAAHVAPGVPSRYIVADDTFNTAYIIDATHVDHSAYRLVLNSIDI